MNSKVLSNRIRIAINLFKIAINLFKMKINRLICRWEYSRLSETGKKMAKCSKIDPDSLIERGKI